MKKKAKIILCSLAGVLVLAGAGFGIGAAVKNANDNVSGTIVQDVTEGTGEYDWKMNETYIPFYNGKTVDDKFYSNGHCMFGSEVDYIYDLKIDTDDSYYCISYETYFSVFDSLDVFFVFDNGYITSTTRTDWDYQGGAVYIEENDINYLKAQGRDLLNAHIVEIWIRTVD